MKLLFYTAITVFAVSLLSNCSSKRSGNHTEERYFTPLDEIPFRISPLEKGTTLKLIAFSGGNQTDNEHTYYHQFIAINEFSGDTIRVLTPLISVGQENIYTTPLQYNHDKGIETASFEPRDSSFYFKINAFAMGDKLTTDSTTFDKMQKKSDADEMVVMVKKVPLFENTHYKTVIGALHFDEQPW
jgi:hypothetical protein